MNSRKCVCGTGLMLGVWLSVIVSAQAAELLVETESFADKGGWLLDTQFCDLMGSPYLLAHGLGTPVADAVTTVTLPQAGAWRLWVRTRDWTPDFDGDKPGRFQVVLNGAPQPAVFGTAPATWGWVDGGTFDAAGTALEIRLRDLTGFEGRCDALYLTTDAAAAAPPDAGAALDQWRAQLRGETEPAATESFELVVVGGGFGGCCAALAAARSGVRVALVQDRPVLGGNASQEVRVASRGDRRYRIVDEIDTYDLSNRSSTTVSRDAARQATVQADSNITLFMPWRAYAAGTNAARRVAYVDIRRADSGQRLRLTAPLFVDATGDGWIGYWAGADWSMGREARAAHEESLAPVTADLQTMGNTLMWTTKLNAEPVDFPTDLPWAASVAGAAAETGGDWDWEYGINASLDTIWDAEHIRDHLLRAIYGNFANAKLNAANANRSLDWVPYVAGKRESRRILGPYVFSQSDVLVGRYFEDAVVTTDWGIDLHRETAISYRSTYTNYGKVVPCYVPYRCLFSRSVPNLFLAGRDISVTHVGLGSPRVMNTVGQLGVTVGYAAAICVAQACEPADIYRYAEKFDALRASLDANAISTSAWPENPWLASTSVVDNADSARVMTYGQWTVSTADGGKYGANYLHDGNTDKGEKFVLFRPDTSLTGDYAVSLWNSISTSRATNAPVWVITSDVRTAPVSPNAYGRSKDPLSHYGGAEFLIGRDIPDKFFRGYLRFDLSSLPPGALVEAATLTLTVNYADTASDNSTAGASGITVHALTEPFDSAAVTWSNRMADVAWATAGGTFSTSSVLTALASPPYPPQVSNGMVLAFPSTTNLLALVHSVQTNSASDKAVYLVVRTPDLEKTYTTRKLYRFAEARLEVAWVDPTIPPTTRVDLMTQQAQWRDIGTFHVGTSGIRVVIGNADTEKHVTADAVRVSCVRTDIDPEDYDGNGLPNAWERRWFLQETGTDPLADPDGDGKTNLEEFEHNTDPLDPKSRPESGTRILIVDGRR